MQNFDRAELGDPDIQIHRFRMWVHGWEHPEFTDYWDGNWLIVSLNCSSESSDVWLKSACVTAPEIEGIGTMALRLLNGGAQKPTDEMFMEPYLGMEFRREGNEMSVLVTVAPVTFLEHHSFVIHLQPADLQQLISQCESVVRRFPTRGLE